MREGRLAFSADAFASERRGIFEQIDPAMREAVKTAMVRFGLPQWQDAIVEEALSVFDQTIRLETDVESQALEDLRGAFALELQRTLGFTGQSVNQEAQIDLIARWVATASVNAATEAATTVDPDTGVGLEWVSMEDTSVRHSHKEAAGQVVPSGQPFSVGGVDVLYPGQPVGDPSLWLNCRCVARPTMLTEAAASAKTFASTPSGASGETDAAPSTPGNVSDPGVADGEEPKAAVVVLLPREGEPVRDIASGTHPHMTLLYGGDAAMDLADLKNTVAAAAKAFPHPITDKVNGRAVLGSDKADVLLMDATGSSLVREWLMEEEPVPAFLSMQEQFPAWIPHVTLGYPEAPSTGDELPEDITYDRLAVWRGNEQYEFPLGDQSEEKPVPDSITAAVGVNVGESDADIAGEEFAEVEKLAAEQYAPVPWHGVLAPEGVPSGDARSFAEGALTHRALPLPLKWMDRDADGHDGSMVVGRIDRIWRDGNLVKASGVFDNSEAAYKAIAQLAEGSIRGVSVDVDDIVASVDEESSAMSLTKARIAAATICAIPAFAEAFVALGPWEEEAGEPVAEQVESEGGEGQDSFASAPGLKKDGTPPKCDFCEAPATQYVLHSEGMAFVPACDEHIEDAKAAASTSTPGGQPDPGNIDRVGNYQIDILNGDLAGVGGEVVQMAGATATFDIPPRKTKDGPGWITDPKPTKQITSYWVDGRGAAKIAWGTPGDFNRCRANLAKYVQNPDWLAGLCANLHYRALGAWPGQASIQTSGMEEAAPSMVASVTPVETREQLPADWFKDPQLDGPTPFTVMEDGRVFGHLATWGTCHIGYADCETAPMSVTNYAYFRTGEVLTDAGPVAVGQVTMGEGGHADERASLRATLAHYDSTTTAVADVTAGEDSFGIWVAGALREGLSAKQVRELRGASLSGDWRRVLSGAGKGNLEMVAALAVNVPGFPIPRASLAASGSRQLSLVAAGIIPHADTKGAALNTEELAAMRAEMRTLQADEVRMSMKKLLEGVK